MFKDSMKSCIILTAIVNAPPNVITILASGKNMKKISEMLGLKPSHSPPTLYKLLNVRYAPITDARYININTIMISYFQWLP